MLTPEQKKRVSEIRDSIDLMDSQAAGPVWSRRPEKYLRVR